MGKIRRLPSKVLKIQMRKDGYLWLLLSLIWTFSLVSNGSVFAATHGNTISGTINSLIISNPISLEVVPTGNGTMSVGSTTVTVTTDSPNGYQLKMSGANNDTNGYTSLYKNGEVSTTSPRLFSITGNNTTLTNNTWGYSLSDYSSYVGNQYASGEIASLTFSGVSSTEATIKTTSASASSGDSTTIYVGARVDTSTPAGIYNNTLNFTSVMERGYTDTGVLTVSPTSGDIGTTITLTTDYTNAISALPANKVSVKLFSDTEYASSSVADCTSITVDSTNNGTAGKPLKVTCSIPTSAASSLTNGGNYGIAVLVDDPTSGQTFTYWQANAYTITTKYSYSITYNANGGSGTVAAQTGEQYIGQNATVTVSSNTGFSRTNYDFLGWNISSTATSASLTPGSSTITLTQSDNAKTLHAIWKIQTWSYSVTYSSGTCTNASGMPGAITGSAYKGESYTATLTFPSVTCSNGYAFKGWSTSNTATTATYTSGGTKTITLSESSPSQTVYAVGEQAGITNGMAISAVTASVCANTPKSDTTTYTLSGHSVRRLADGNCWTVSDVATSATWANAPAMCSNLGGGWTLPSQAQYQALVNAGLTVSAWNSSSSGFYGWWSSTAYNSSNAYYLYLYDGAFNPSNYSLAKTRTLSVRCVRSRS